MQNHHITHRKWQHFEGGEPSYSAYKFQNVLVFPVIYNSCLHPTLHIQEKKYTRPQLNRDSRVEVFTRGSPSDLSLALEVERGSLYPGSK